MKEAIEKAALEMSSDVLPVPAPGSDPRPWRTDIQGCQLLVRMATQILKCFNAKFFTFSHQQTALTAPTATQVQWQSPEVVGKWCVLKSKGDLSPGVITDANETHVEVCKIVVNGFFWPAREDILGTCLRILCASSHPRNQSQVVTWTLRKVWAKLEKAS